MRLNTFTEAVSGFDTAFRNACIGMKNIEIMGLAWFSIVN